MPRLTLLKPLITEKTMRLAQAGQFTFLVRPKAAKSEVAAAVSTQFKVDVVKVATGIIKGKAKKTGRRRLTKRSANRKKAVITLKPGQSLEFFKLPEKKMEKKK